MNNFTDISGDGAGATFVLRWRGKQEGPYPASEIERKLAANEVGMLHEIYFDGQWMSIRSFIQAREALRRAESKAREEARREAAEREQRKSQEEAARQTRSANARTEYAENDNVTSGDPAERRRFPTDEVSAPEDVGGFSTSDFFSEVFHRHPKGLIEDNFCVGGSKTTPTIGEIIPVWPRPWLFARVFFISIFIFCLFCGLWLEYQNTKLLPAILLVGSFAIPISTLVLFIEANLWKNVPLYHVMKLFAWGSVLSLFSALYLYDLLSDLPKEVLNVFGATIAGPIEETAKLLTAVFVSRHLGSKKILNGLLIGAAVGAGFSAFESAGYGFEFFLRSVLSPQMGPFPADSFNSGVLVMIVGIIVRGILSPWSHIAWTAMATAALWQVKGNRPFDMSLLFKPRFLGVFIVAVLLHMAWDSELLGGRPITKYATLCLIGSAMVIAMMQAGIRQIAEERAGVKSSTLSESLGGSHHDK